MKINFLSKYSQSPYIIIGLDQSNNNLFIHLSGEKSVDIKQIFDTIGDCEDFIVKQINNVKLVLIISGDYSTEQLTKIQSYSQVDAIYSYSKSSDLNEELKCIYTKTTEKKSWNIFVTLLKKFWFILGVLVVLISAYLFPHLGAAGGVLHSEYTIKWGCVIIIFFLNGLSLSTTNLAEQLLRFRLYISIQVFSILLVPCIIYCIALLLALTSFNKVLISGIILMACTSTAISTNVVMTRNAGGNEYTALVSALLGNILGIFIAPVMIYLFMKNIGLNVVKNLSGISNYGRVIVTLSLTVLLPLIIGQIINRIWTEKVMWAKVKFHFSEVASLALLILVWSVLCNLFQSGALKAISSFEFLVLIVLNALFFVSFTLLALFIARLPNIFVCRKENRDEQSLLMEPQQKEATLIERWRFSREDTIAFMFCGATKTVANGAPLIAAIFAGQNQTLISLLTLPLILYHVEQLILCSIAVLFLQRWLKRHSLADKKELCQQ